MLEDPRRMDVRDYDETTTDRRRWRGLLLAAKTHVGCCAAEVEENTVNSVLHKQYAE